jgi:glycosyltransferase involved in cell wall biosynthesis
MKIAVYIGYTNLNEQHYGSELALLALVDRLKVRHDVKLFTVMAEFKDYHHLMVDHNDYIDNTYDILLIHRYINFYVYFPIRAKKVFIWVHDVCLHSSYQGRVFPYAGHDFLQNVKYDKIVLQTEWHRKRFLEYYPTLTKNEIIGNGIETKYYTKDVQKVPFRFIYTSSPKRGLTYLMNVFPKIREVYPDAELHIFRDLNEATPEQLKILNDGCDKGMFVYGGALSNQELADEFLQAEVWLYPTDFTETYCISAVEAQAAGCLCVCSRLAGLIETVGDRGILLESVYGSKEYDVELLQALERVFKDKNEYSGKARTWGLQQDWDNRAKMWEKMFTE